MLAPTEILATQHSFYFKKLFQKLGYVTIRLRVRIPERESGLRKLAAAGARACGLSGRMRCSRLALNLNGLDWRLSMSSIGLVWSSGRS